ncbi:protein translocase subunit SecF [Cylindrospermopsis raciborskii]|uniref:Protein-export membrane protein SecF n=1 Tax=Cylindrospermopsis raciborskii CENA302 TaxID=1170768 RepID=A0A9Q5QWR9_9CYAN|nr:protein translocase subunit SecF [Cylindrospermopsis raciborskii]MCZ2201503.1 protein translocase subunit SecF [Cylindrospermopsis raciborskii PAMP2012]MCZ2205460.1 protein translocase subunit SecF [Cylindrospermopsis raciborskii PAMP2011]NLQ05878.1 protein translocase subunit SecF [Cylindrospermopsis raciborskii MVCC19]OHY36215.1 protein-export membrane protein SecF [Cylindrospermopsis raciborskii MVCC14]OPH09938.1 protein-export membrane protein SecF [Cylindrospermopsis raciborskii CENA30
MRLHVNKWRNIWWLFSSVIIISGIISMVISWQIPTIKAPLRPGLDFIGGTRLQLVRDCQQPGNCNQPIDINVVREVAKEQGLGESSIQLISDNGEQNGITIRTKNLDTEQRVRLQSALSQKVGVFDPQKNQIDDVGPTLGRELFRSGIIALIVSFIGITIYLAVRFQWDYAVFAIIALLHDILITVGIFSIFGLVFGIEVDSLFIVALLTITGFSVNDTVVIYDRIRENIKVNPQTPIDRIVDDAVDQTLTRSINTTLTTMLSLVAIFIFGGETLKYFSLALIIGFGAGVYSSIFIASTLLTLWRERSSVQTYTEIET